MKSKFLSRINNLLYFPEFLQENKVSLQYNIRKELLIQQALTCKEKGISDEKYFEQEVVFSMASYGTRVTSAYLAIESIMQQSIKPNRLILCLPEEWQSRPLPKLIQNQQKRGLEIIYNKDIWSFKKLIPALRKYPESIIITGDDDCLYNVDFIENLLASHRKDPLAIWGNRIHKVTFNKKGYVDYYSNWQWEIPNTDESSKLFFITTVGGVLYPPHSLFDDVTKEEIFMDIAKYNDDIWCYAMALLKGTKIKRSFTHSPRGVDYYSLEESQYNRLSKNNVSAGYSRNDQIFRAVFEHYGLYDIIKCP